MSTIEREELPDRPEESSEALEEIFDRSAHVLERIILRKL